MPVRGVRWEPNVSALSQLVCSSEPVGLSGYLIIRFIYSAFKGISQQELEQMPVHAEPQCGKLAKSPNN